MKWSRVRRVNWFELLVRAFVSGTIVIAAIAMVRALWPTPAWRPPELKSHAVPETPRLAPALQPLEAFEVVWKRDLRQSLIDPPPIAPAPVAATVAVQLIGTLADLDHPVAVFGLADGRTVARRVGESVEGYELTEIGRGRAVLSRSGQPLELRVPWYARIVADSGGTNGQP